MTHRIRTRFLVIGSGVAGLHAAWRASVRGPVTVLTKRPRFESATAYAQGGIAAALGAGDSPDLHRQDTLAAGAALCDAEAVPVLVEDGSAPVRERQAAGARFDLDPEGGFPRGKEAAHSRHRIRYRSRSPCPPTAPLVAEAALMRKESRGGHFRGDFPTTRQTWQDRQITWSRRSREYGVRGSQSPPHASPHSLLHTPDFAVSA